MISWKNIIINFRSDDHFHFLSDVLVYLVLSFLRLKFLFFTFTFCPLYLEHAIHSTDGDDAVWRLRRHVGLLRHIKFLSCVGLLRHIRFLSCVDLLRCVRFLSCVDLLRCVGLLCCVKIFLGRANFSRKFCDVAREGKENGIKLFVADRFRVFADSAGFRRQDLKMKKIKIKRLEKLKLNHKYAYGVEFFFFFCGFILFIRLKSNETELFNQLQYNDFCLSSSCFFAYKFDS